MRIAFLATGFPDYSVEAATALAKRADVLLAGDRDRLRADSSLEKLERFRERGRLLSFRQNSLRRRVQTVLATTARIARFRPDVIVAHEHAHPHIAWLHRILGLNAKILLIIHDPIPHEGRDGDFATRNARHIAVQRRIATAYLVHGDYCAQALAAVANPDGRAIVTVPHGPVLRPEKIIPPPAVPKFLMFGRMEEYKGLDLLLDAFRILRRRGKHYHLQIAGAGPSLDALQGDFEALGNCDIRNAFIPREDAIQDLSSASMVLAPYREATQSGVVAAAFANGRGVIATRVGGLPDFIRDGVNGLLVPGGSASDFADAIERAATSPDLVEEISNGAKKSAASEMSWDVVANIIIEQASFQGKK